MRQRESFSGVWVLLLSLGLISEAGAVETDTVTTNTGTLVGVAVEDISPPFPAYMISADVLVPVENLYHKLEAKALAISDDGAPVVIVTADIATFCTDVSEQVYERVKPLGFEPHQVVLNATHNHSAPGTCPEDNVVDPKGNPVGRYQAFLVTKLVSVIRHAKENMQPALLSTSESTCNICINRDGPPHTMGRLFPYPDGPIDRRVRLLQVKDPTNNRLRAVLTLFACHVSDVTPKNWTARDSTVGQGAFGADYFGYARDEVQRKYPGVVVLTAQGTGGDVRVAHFKNNDINQNFTYTYWPDMAPNKEYGRRFAAAIMAGLRNPAAPVKGRVRAGMSAVELPVEQPASRDFVARVARREEKSGIDSGMPQDPFYSQKSIDNPYYARWGAWMLSKYDQGIPILDTVGPYQMRVIQFGDDLTVAALDGEDFTCIGKQVEQRLGPTRTYVLGYTNNVRAYIPCAANFAPPQNGGNYEIQIYYWWLWQTARLKPNVDSVIVDETVALAQRVRTQ